MLVGQPCEVISHETVYLNDGIYYLSGPCNFWEMGEMVRGLTVNMQGGSEARGRSGDDEAEAAAVGGRA